MVKRSSNGKGENELLRLYDLLDRYEELIEDLSELGVRSIDEAERKIEELNQRIDALEGDADGKSA
jgi:hypothetical protein